MNDRTPLGPWIRRFLLEHVVAERNLARNTQTSYRDTLALLLPFLSATIKTSVDRLAVEDLSPGLLRRFLEHLQHDRGCGDGTRNQRLAALHSLAKFIGLHSPAHLAWCADLRTIPFKKTAHPAMAYLDKPEVEALLKIHRARTEQGARNHALLLFLYNTGARVDEAAHLTVADLTLGPSPSVCLVGKGNKTRACPLWPVTADALKQLMHDHAPQDRVFRNRHGRPLTRFGIYSLVQRTVAQGPLRSPRSASALTRCATPARCICCAPASISIPSGRGWGMSPWTRPMSTPRSTST
jgi:site-specific recombinase XerD